MAIAEPLLNTQSQGEPQPRRWTVAEFERAIDAGLFGPEERLELVQGEIIRKMPQAPPHAAALMLLITALIRVFANGYMVRGQLPLNFGDNTGERPEPDVAVVAGVARDFVQRHPATAALVVEVSDSTLHYDRTIKASVYARFAIPEYWILNIPERTLEVHRDPAALPGEPPHFHYRSVITYAREEAVAPLAAPAIMVRVADLLP